LSGAAENGPMTDHTTLIRTDREDLMKTLWCALTTILIGTFSLTAAATTTAPTDVQSPHPYLDNMDEMYFIEAPEGASDFEIHFAWVDLENNYDFLFVRDSQGNLLQTLTGFQNNFTVNVPDTQAMLQLVSDYSVTRQGFVIDALIYQPSCMCPTIWAPMCGKDGVTYGSMCWADCSNMDTIYVGQCLWHDVDEVMESAHPYPNNLDQTWTIQAPEPTAHYKLHFEDIDTESGYDELRIIGDTHVHHTLTGDLGSRVIALEAWEVQLRLVTDYSVQDYGFTLTGWSYLDMDGVEDACVAEGEFADPADQCCEGLDKVKDCLPNEDCARHVYWCIDAADGVCGDHENEYNSVADCHDTSCDDGTQPMCEMIPPVCDEGLILAYQGNCYSCVDPVSCEEPTIPDCQPTGCSGQICAAGSVITTCEWIDFYACYHLPDVAVCGYDTVAGECAWMDAQPDSLAQCMNQAALGVGINETCGTIMGKVCDPGLTCNYDGDYPDAGGNCEEINTWHTRVLDVQSPHPYSNDLYEEYAITVVAAEQIRAHFSDFATENSYDGVTLRGPSGTWWTGDLGAFWTPEVEGDTLELELETDYSITDFGFAIDKVEYYR
jgi:CUB domain/Kazal-type serine protease inhibitor domain